MNKIKSFILNRKFVQDVIKSERRQGAIDAFPLAHKDVLETMADDIDKRAEELAKKKLNDLLSPVDLNGVLASDKTGKYFFINGERVEDAVLANLRSEAEFLLSSSLWKLLVETPKELAQRTMFVNSESLADLQKGKSILYTLSTQKNIIDMLKNTKINISNLSTPQ